MCNNMYMVDVMMSGTRLFEALKAEARRTDDIDAQRDLIRRWNERCVTLGKKLEAEARARRANGSNPFAALGWS